MSKRGIIFASATAAVLLAVLGFGIFMIVTSGQKPASPQENVAATELPTFSPATTEPTTEPTDEATTDAPLPSDEPTDEASTEPTPSESASPSPTPSDSPSPVVNCQPGKCANAYGHVALANGNYAKVREAMEVSAKKKTASTTFDVHFYLTGGANMGRFEWDSASNLTWTRLFLIRTDGSAKEIPFDDQHRTGDYTVSELGGSFVPAPDAAKSSVTFDVRKYRGAVVYGNLSTSPATGVKIDPAKPVLS